MAATPLVPVVDEANRLSATHTAAEIDLDELQEARRDPRIKALLKKAAAEGARVEREGRKRW